MTFDSVQDSASAPRTTAVGLEAWLSGVHAEPAQAAPVPPSDNAPKAAAIPPVQTPADIPATVEEIGPVNLAEALALGRVSSARKLLGPDGAELTIDPENKAYYFEATSLKPLAAILQQPADQWTPIYSEALKTARAADPAQSLERLRWYAGLIATPGILGRELSRGERYKLIRWPETEREFPKHFRIATAMFKAPATAAEITAASGVAHEDVIDYINASHAAGRLETASTAHADAGHTASRKGSLMSRLNKPLFAR